MRALGLIALLLVAVPAEASSPVAWAASRRAAQAACVKASGLVHATAGAPTEFSDRTPLDVVRVRGRIAAGAGKGMAVTMVCLFDRVKHMAETQEVPRGW